MEKLFARIRWGIDHTVPYVSAILFIFTVFAACLAIFNRTLGLGIPTFWVEEISIYCMIWATMLLLGQLLRKGLHTQFTVLLDHLPAKGVAILRIVILLFCLAAFLILAIGGWKSATESAGTLFFTLNISLFWPYLSIPVSAVLGIIEVIMIIAEEVAVLLGKMSPAEVTQAEQAE